MLVGLPVKLGQVVKFISTTLDDLAGWVTGVFIIVILILAVLKILFEKFVIKAVKNVLGLG